MKSSVVLALAVGCVALSGCDSVASRDATLGDVASASGSSLKTHSAPDASSSLIANEITLNGHRVVFLGASVAGGATTFTYQLTSIDPGPPSLDWFFLENACGAVPLATQPSNAVREATVDGVRGVKWNGSLPPGETRTYAYTFAGEREVRIARTMISRGGVSASAYLPGPCGGAYLRGSVFVDADGDAGQSPTELGIGAVRVEVYAGATLVESVQTLADGRFAFLLPTGAYTLRIPTSAPDAFNATLYGSYLAPGGAAPAERPITLTADVSGQNVGFRPDRQQIVADLSPGGAYQTRAQDVRFWQTVVRNAARNRATTDPYGGTITPAEVSGYLAAIFSTPGEASSGYYLLADPFVQIGTDPLAAAADLLAKPTRSDLDKVSRNLFAMELNLMRGWGTPDRAYDDLLMSYLEEWVRTGGAPAGGALRMSEPTGPTDRLGGGGGGTVEEQMTSAYLGGGGGGTVED